MECAVLDCKKSVTSDTGRVEVRAYQVSDSQRTGLKVGWSESGDAVFHPDCWSSLVQATKKNPSKKTHLQLNDLETSLVVEAKKHAEFHDSDAMVKSEAARIAQLIKDAKHCIAFTGAGISTAAGIGDFRGKDGKWTEKDKLKDHGEKGKKKGGRKGHSYSILRPTYTHEAIMKLQELGHIKYVISQNCDGLHRLSGIPESKISELHGNVFVQKCEKCETRYTFPRSYRVYREGANFPSKKCKRCHIDHRTGRTCEKKGCGGYLMNTIINFGDYLEEDVLDKAEKNAKQSDLVICLGSTLGVSPANALVMMGQKPNRLVICNRQGTDYDSNCTKVDDRGVPIGSRVFGDCDKLMKELMLALFGPEFVHEWEEGRDARLSQYDSQRT